MDDLLNTIRAAQVSAAEAAVIADLEAKGLIEKPKPTLAELKADMLAKIRAAEKSAYAYFRECEVGDERIRAHEVYENLLYATRVR